MALEQKDIPLLLQIERLKEEVKKSKKIIINLQKQLASAGLLEYQRGKHDGHLEGRFDLQKELRSLIGLGEED